MKAGSGEHSNSEGFWRVRWEEERKRHEETRKKFSKQLHGAKAVVGKKNAMLLRAGAVLEARTLRQLESSAFEAWISWMSDERKATA